MLTLEDIEKIEDIIENMTDEEVEEAIQRIEKLAAMQNDINEAYQTNPMVFSACETIQ
jgi:4'-phosphopantetheinyl transferase EntD